MNENVFQVIADCINDNTRITIDADDVKSLFESLIPEDPEFDCELGYYVCPMCKQRIDDVGIFKCESCGKALTKFDKDQYIVKYKDLLEYAVRNANKILIRHISKKEFNENSIIRINTRDIKQFHLDFSKIKCQEIHDLTS